jgi:hypothetical protein
MADANASFGRRMVATAIAAAAIGGGLLWLRAHDSIPGPTGSTSVPIRTNGWRSGMEANGAGGEAIVRVRADDCVYLEIPDGRGGHSLNVIWPAGYAASRAPDGNVTVYNQDDQPVARDGSHIFIGGGTGSGRGCNPAAAETWDMQFDLEPVQ